MTREPLNNTIMECIPGTGLPLETPRLLLVPTLVVTQKSQNPGRNHSRKFKLEVVSQIDTVSARQPSPAKSMGG